MSGFGLEGLGTELGVLNLAGWIAYGVNKFLIPYLRVRGVMKEKEKKSNPGNPGSPGPRPGDGKTCKENRDKLIRLETKVDDMKEDIKTIFRKLDKI